MDGILDFTVLDRRFARDRLASLCVAFDFRFDLSKWAPMPCVKWALAIAVAANVLVCPVPSTTAQNGKFDPQIAQNGVGVAPADFDFWIAGEGAASQWAVVRDDSARSEPVIEQFSSDKTEHGLPLVSAKDNTFSVSLDGHWLFVAIDDALAESGRITLRTKADSVTQFDRIEITPLTLSE